MTTETLHVLWAIGLSPFIGSFLGVLVKRLPAGQGVVLSRSRAPCCGHRLAMPDLLPLLSWVGLGGRCRFCGAFISPFYPAIELAALAVAAWGATVVDGWMVWPTVFLGWSLLALALIDAERFLLPDALTLPLLGMGLAAAWMIAPDRILSHAGGAAAGYLAFEAVRHAYTRLRGKEGLGRGDSKLLAASGAWVSWGGLPSVVLLASVAGLLWVLGTRRRGRVVSPSTAVPFGPFLALGTWLVWLYGPLLVGGA